MVKKATKRDKFLEVFDILTDLGKVDEAEFIANEIALIDRKRNAPRALTETQRENIALKQRLFGRIANADEAVRAGDLAKAEDITVQKATALLRQLVLDGLVERVEDGKVTLFRIAARD